MATNKTENFGLNQWVKSDEVVMKDFNEDNAKIDAALDAATRIVKLVDVTLEEEGLTQWNIDLSHIDFLQYHKIDLSVDCPDPSQSLFMLVNNLSSYAVYPFGSTNGSTHREVFAIFGYNNTTNFFFNPITQNSQVQCFYDLFGSNRYANSVRVGILWKNLTSLNFTASVDKSAIIPSGIRVILYGIRK